MDWLELDLGADHKTFRNHKVVIVTALESYLSEISPPFCFSVLKNVAKANAVKFLSVCKFETAQMQLTREAGLLYC